MLFWDITPNTEHMEMFPFLPPGAVSICPGFLTVCSFSLSVLGSKPKETPRKSCDKPRDVVDT